MDLKTFNPNGVGVDNGAYYGLPFTPEEAALVLVSAPWDVTVSYGAGTALAPDALIEASTQLDLYDASAPGAWLGGIATADIDYSLQEESRKLRADAERVLHGSETGIIERSPDGGYSEPHRPISIDEKFTLTQHVQGKALEATPDTDGHGVAEKGAGVSSLRALASRWFYAGVIAKPTKDEIAEADHHPDGHDADGHEVTAAESESAGQISH